MHTPRAGRIAVIGAGHVGSTTAYALMLRALFGEIVLIDSDSVRAAAEAADLADANALARPVRIWAGNYGDAATAAIAVLTAGASTHGSQDRLSVASASAGIVADCTRQLVSAGFNGIILVAANPVDVMTEVAQSVAGFAPGRVIGTGTLLDSSRLKQMLGQRLHVAAGSVDALVLGEHGDSAVVAFSGVRVGGMPLDAFAASTRIDHAALVAEVRGAGYCIVSGKGFTSFGIATAIVRLCDAISRDEHAVLPCSTRLTGQLGLRDVCISLPCVVARAGVVRILEPVLSDDERIGLLASAEIVRRAAMLP